MDPILHLMATRAFPLSLEKRQTAHRISDANGNSVRVEPGLTCDHPLNSDFANQMPASALRPTFRDDAPQIIV